MKTTLENINSVQKKLKIEVPGALVQKARGKALETIQKKAKIKGFRPGKVPLPVVEKNFQGEVLQETVETVVRETYPKAVEESKVQPISRPQIQPGTFQADQSFSYEATFEVRPDIVIKDYKGVKLEKEIVEIDAAMVEEELKRLQQSMTQLEPMADDTVLAEGHVATIDFSGKVEGKDSKETQAKDHVVEVGAGQVLPELEKQLKGLKKGEKKEVSFVYPKDYFNKDLAAKQASFQVTLKEIRKKNVPPLNDDFAKDLGNYENLAQVKSEIEKRMQNHKENETKGVLFRKILEELIAKNKFDIPESMVQGELQSMVENLARELSQRGQKLEDLDLNEVIKNYRPEAEFRTRGFLILDTIAVTEQLGVADAEMETFIATQATAMKRPVEQLKAYYEKQQMLGSLKLRLLHEKALEFVLTNAKIKEVKAKKKDK